MTGMTAKLHVVCLLCAGAAIASAHAQEDLEYPVKAAFLCKFAKFVEWPAEAFKTRDDPLVICVLGDDPFGGILDETVKDQTVNNRPIVVQRVQRAQDLPACHILFVAPSERRRLQDIFRKVGSSSIVTIGDSTGFAESGGTIGFIIEDGKVHFEINVAAAERASLKLSAKLLKLARMVKEARP